MARHNGVYLRHILDAMSLIEEYSADTEYNDFMNNRMLQDALIRELEIVGEATKNLTDDLKEKHPEVPWRRMAGMRDRLIHGYFGVDLDAVWDTVTFLT